MSEQPLRILYFAWLRERVGRAEETIAFAPEVASVAGLLAHLRARGEGHARAFAATAQVRAAVNQVFAGPDTALHPGDEVAFFPPVTGG